MSMRNGKGKFFLIIYPYDGEIFIDTKALPQSALLCAMCDNTRFLLAKVGGKRKQERSFVSIDWIINDWGGPEELVSLVKRKKQDLMDEMEQLKVFVESE